MNERTVLMGTKAPPKTVTAGGATYRFAPAISYGTMTAFEEAAFAHDKKRLKAVQDVSAPEDYRAATKELALAYQTGEYAFGGPRALKHLQTPDGMLDLLRLLSVDGTEADELFGLITNHNDALQEALEEILEASFPEAAPAPKAKAPRHKRGR